MLSRRSFRRPARAGEWSGDKAVTFIVTLAASFSVTLAAARAGMSRKSAYALKRRDPVFAAAWDKAVQANDKLTAMSMPRAPARGLSKGDEGDEPHNPPVAPPKGNDPARRARDEALRDSFFAALATRHPDLAAAVLADTCALA